VPSLSRSRTRRTTCPHPKSSTHSHSHPLWGLAAAPTPRLGVSNLRKQNPSLFSLHHFFPLATFGFIAVVTSFGQLSCPLLRAEAPHCDAVARCFSPRRLRYALAPPCIVIVLAAMFATRERWHRRLRQAPTARRDSRWLMQKCGLKHRTTNEPLAKAWLYPIGSAPSRYPPKTAKVRQ